MRGVVKVLEDVFRVASLSAPVARIPRDAKRLQVGGVKLETETAQ